MNRRSFLKALAGGAVLMSAGGIALLEAEPIVKTYFLPPRCGWNAGSWELAYATEALRIVTAKLEEFTAAPALVMRADETFSYHVVTSVDQSQIDSLLARRARLVERVDKLARGWTPYYTSRTLYAADGTQFTTRIHGGREDGRRS